MFVSVVIATRNRSALLGQTLDAVARQQWPHDRLEIVVADNGSTDDTRLVVERAAARTDGEVSEAQVTFARRAPRMGGNVQIPCYFPCSQGIRGSKA